MNDHAHDAYNSYGLTSASLLFENYYMAQDCFYHRTSENKRTWNTTTGERNSLSALVFHERRFREPGRHNKAHRERSDTTRTHTHTQTHDEWDREKNNKKKKERDYQKKEREQQRKVEWSHSVLFGWLIYSLCVCVFLLPLSFLFFVLVLLCL